MLETVVVVVVVVTKAQKVGKFQKEASLTDTFQLLLTLLQGKTCAYMRLGCHQSLFGQPTISQINRLLPSIHPSVRSFFASALPLSHSQPNGSDNLECPLTTHKTALSRAQTGKAHFGERPSLWRGTVLSYTAPLREDEVKIHLERHAHKKKKIKKKDINYWFEPKKLTHNGLKNISNSLTNKYLLVIQKYSKRKQQRKSSSLLVGSRIGKYKILLLLKNMS